MIGNDIVDLSKAHVGIGKRRERYLKKIFSDKEINLIQNANDEDLMIWLMWSIKESVYKLIVRQDKKIRYAPKSICCESVAYLNKDTYQSTVHYEESIFNARSTIKADCIHSIAFDYRSVYNEIKSASFDSSKIEDPRLFLDNKVIDKVKKTQNDVKGEVVILRDQLRIPHIYSGDKEITVLSLSQHGKYSGYAFKAKDILF